MAAAIATAQIGDATTTVPAPAALEAPVQPDNVVPVATVQMKIENTIDAPVPKVPNFDKEVLRPLKAKQQEEANTAMREQCEGWGGSYAPFSDSVAAVCTLPPPPPPPPVASFSEVRVTQPGRGGGGISVSYSSVSYSGLLGSVGYAMAGGNCVNEPGVNNPGWGNPIDWPALTQTPYIGATVLFTYNHTGVVTGIWGNGDIEVRHRNWSGTPITRFPRSAFRGFR